MDWTASITIVNKLFVECLNHSIKPRKYSAKALTTLGKKISENCISATASLPSTFYRELDKGFAECHQVLDKEKSSSQRLVTETEP
jgi:hypothetical protein